MARAIRREMLPRPPGTIWASCLRRARAAERAVLASTTITQLSNANPPVDWVV
jgi:hypothetical protein